MDDGFNEEEGPVIIEPEDIPDEVDDIELEEYTETPNDEYTAAPRRQFNIPVFILAFIAWRDTPQSLAYLFRAVKFIIRPSIVLILYPLN